MKLDSLLVDKQNKNSEFCSSFSLPNTLSCGRIIRNVLTHRWNKKSVDALRNAGYYVEEIFCSNNKESLLQYTNKETEKNPHKQNEKFDIFVTTDITTLPTSNAKLLLYEVHRKLRLGGRAISINGTSKKLFLFCQRTFGPSQTNQLQQTQFNQTNFLFEKIDQSSTDIDVTDNATTNDVTDNATTNDVTKDVTKDTTTSILSSNNENVKNNKNINKKQLKEWNNTKESFALSRQINKVVEILLSDPETSGASQLLNLNNLNYNNWDKKLTANLNSKTTNSTSTTTKKKTKKLRGLEQCVAGLSLGLPNFGTVPRKAFFAEDNLERLFRGESFLSALSGAELDELLRQKVVQLDKSGGVRRPVPVAGREQMFKLVARLGEFDLHEEFGVPRFMIEGCDKTSELAIAAGLKALENAGIQFVKSKEHPFGLPAEMRDETGIIFASSFPQLESCVEAVQRHVTERLSKENLKEGKENFKEGKEPFSFDRKLLFKFLVMANSQLAQLTGARGPNTFVNAACASAAQAIALASDWMRLGRCRRVLVVAADNATSQQLLPYIGNGFLALGACCTKEKESEAAIPFDRRRSGMILGMGAMGVLLEGTSACVRRSGFPLAQLVHSQLSNSAFHGTLLDKRHIASEMERFVAAAEKKLGTTRIALAKDLVYFAHETGTSKGGGCAQAEADALRAVFGSYSEKILVCAVKGQTGHPMGVNSEEAVAVASLAQGRVPPVANYCEKDDRLGDLRLSKGGRHSRCFAMRTAAGFGSQLVFILYKKYLNNKCSLI